jgi:hypothetical protein
LATLSPAQPSGNLELLWQIGLNMLPPTNPDTKEGFQEFLYLAHIYQAVSLKTETETYRWLQQYFCPSSTDAAWCHQTPRPGRA